MRGASLAVTSAPPCVSQWADTVKIAFGRGKPNRDELASELDAAHVSTGRSTRVFSVSPSGDVYAARLGERPRHDRSTALVVWRPLHGR